ncbi:VanW family protein [Patescibacteria group bacterium]|nr:VanW family protein [Patescibacteria group bacterium]
MAKSKKTSSAIAYFLKKNLLSIILSAVLFFLIAITYQVIMADKYYPLTFIGNINISFFTQGEAARIVQANFQQRTQTKLTFNSPQGTYIIDLATSSANLDYTKLSETFSNSHDRPLQNHIKLEIQSLFFPVKITPKITLNLDKQLETIALAVNKQPQDAKLFFDETPNEEGTPSARIQIKNSTNGFVLDKDKILYEVKDYLLFEQYQSLLPLKTTHPKITTEHVLKAKKALEKLEDKPLKLTFQARSWIIDTKQLLTLLDLQTGQDLLLDKEKTYLYLEKIASEIDQPVKEGLFEFNPTTQRVNAFQPSSEGRKLNQDKAFQLINEALSNNQKLVALPVSITKPKIETADINSLGIKKLLGRGISNFAGSITNRIYNIGLTASKISGVLIPPGQTFSFNQTIGDITAATGFKQAYVIKGGRTVLDDGGGVCQDSTTLFRAVLNAGLPVVKRTAHAYRVGYYEQGFPPGLDATVFYPSVDFQFNNDTPAHILIQAYTVGNTLYVDLYGTGDNRIVNITEPVITNQTPPPPDLRQDDPTLPKGTVKQVDWSAWGANVSFKRTVVRNGETIINETWKSFFKPWQAVYLVGTKD